MIDNFKILLYNVIRFIIRRGDVMINLDKFGQIIASNRLSQSMTQSQLAKILLVTPQAVSKWERGESFPDI